MAELPQPDPFAYPGQPTAQAVPAYPVAAPAAPVGQPNFAPPSYPSPGPAGYPSAAPDAYRPATAYPQPAAYPPQPGTYPAPDQPPLDPGTKWGGKDDTTERVGRGLLFSVGGIIVGVVLTVVLWQMNFIASLTSLAMAYACIWLYTKGAGRAPRKGAVPLIGVILLGVIASLVAVFASDAVTLINRVHQAHGFGDYVMPIINFVTSPQVWQSNASSVIMYLVFAAFGSFGIFTGLAKSR